MTLAEQLRNEGIQLGTQLGMIEMALVMKFGDVDKKIMEKIRDIRDVEKLKSVTELVQKTDSLTTVEKLLSVVG